MKKFVGWDCANKTLGWAQLEIDLDIRKKMGAHARAIDALVTKKLSAGFLRGYRGTAAERAALSAALDDDEFVGNLSEIVAAARADLRGFIKITSAGVTDILEGRLVSNTSEIERTHALRRFIDAHPGLTGRPVIEHQPPKIGAKTNNKSTIVSYQLAFCYIHEDPVFINPRLKNNLCFGEGLSFAEFLADEMARQKDPKRARYNARKRHSTANFLRLADVFGLRINGVSDAMMNNLADAVMGVFALIKKEKLL